MKMVLITNTAREFCISRTIKKRIEDEYPKIEFESFLVESKDEFPYDHQKAAYEADMTLFLWMGTGLESTYMQQTSRYLQKYERPHIIVVENAAPTDRLFFGVKEEDVAKVRRYIHYDGEENVLNCVLWLASLFGKTDYAYDEPKEVPWNGVWHPAWREDCQNLDGYLKKHYVEGRPTVGIVFYRTEWLTGNFAYHTALIRAIEQAGMNVIAVFTNTVKREDVGAASFADALHRYFYKDGERLIDVLVNTMKFSLKIAGTSIEEFQKLNVPILEAYTMLCTKEAWEESSSGLDPMEVSISVSLPEFDGVIHSVPITAKVRNEIGEVTYVPIEERIERLVSKMKKWAALAHKPNKDKKIAIIFHNYPPKNSNIGSAAGLDSPESVRRLLDTMQKEGYVVDHIPEDSRSFMKELTDNATNDRRFISDEQVKNAYGHITAEEYFKFYKELPAHVQARLEFDWGKAPGEVFNYDDVLLVPGTLNGNIFITVQPPRGFGEDPGKLLHSPDASPTHHYIGFYHWIRDLWKADTVVHVGTHGSLEWLPGKSTALSNACYPDISLGDLPDIYPYWITIVGEGLQAKRRGAACLISHLSPPMQLSGSFEELQELETALDEYIHFRQTQPDNLDSVQDIVRERAAACNLNEDVPEGEDFDEYVARLHNYVTDIKNLQIRTGLHIMGRMPEENDLTEFLMALVRLDNAEQPSLLRFMAEEAGYTYEDLLEHSERMTPDGVTYGKKLDEFGSIMHDAVDLMQARDFDDASIADVLRMEAFSSYGEEAKKKLRASLAFICETLVPKLRKTAQEITNTVRALSGEYIEPSPAGAPTTNGSELLPTGRNFYGVDPRMMPTPAAWELGKQLGDGVISQFIADEGRYPEAIGIVFWAGANMRSHGQCISEMFYLMGVRPKWQHPSLQVAGVEVIPLSELKRPRIDVTGRISGLFRDSMPDAIKWIDEAVKIVSALDESDEDNYIRKHVKADAAWLSEQGESEDTAWRKASYRIFGDPPGAYGAGVGALLESKQWDTLDDIAAVYTRFSGTPYGGDGLPTNYEPELFQRRMSILDVTIKNEDSRETHMFSSDDFNAYHGGMIATVRALTGKAPHSYSGDSSDRKRVKVRTVQEEAKRLFRGEAMNPKFIEGMKKHGYKGAADLANYLAHSYQWDATSKVMEDWMYEKFAEKYALDKDMQEWMKDVNPWALQRMADILLEAEQRGLWQANPETKEALEELYLSIEGELEERADTAGSV